MTAYGQAAVDAAIGRIVVEIHTVNKKNLEIFCHMAKELRRFESALRSAMAGRISSGQVTIHVRATFHKDAPVRLAAHIPFAEQLKKEYEKIQKALGLKEPLSLSLFARHDELFAEEENKGLLDQIEPLLLQGLEGALEQCLSMKKREGAILKKDLKERLKNLRKAAEDIRKLAQDEPERFREKLEALYEKLKMLESLDEERAIREIALFAEKVDIAEEITRLFSHFEQTDDLLKSEEPVGKTLDFLFQEINREINTIASKSQNIAITRLVIAMKTEISKMREQVLNVE